MKVKLLKVSANIDSNDDYTDIVRHVVNSQSDYEEISPSNLSLLEKFVRGHNYSYRRGSGGGDLDYYLIVYGPADLKATEAIEIMVQIEEEKERKTKKERELVEQQRLTKLNETSATRALKKKLRLEKQLEKIKEELEKK